MSDKEAYLAEEIIIVRHSGELPEVALHGSLYYLTEDPAGPQLKLLKKDITALKSQVIARYLEIIMRDLDPENRDKSIYRGLKRGLANWRRLRRFCEREKKGSGPLRRKTAGALLKFLAREIEDVQSGARQSCLNCCATELANFAREVGLGEKELPAGWQSLVEKGA